MCQFSTILSFVVISIIFTFIFSFNSTLTVSNTTILTNMAPLTLFLFEETTSFNFRLESKTYEEMQEEGFTIQTILRTLELTSGPNKYNFFMFGGLNRKATRFVDNPGMFSCYETQNDKPIITIIVRYKSDPSPYYAQAPSAMASLQARQALSGLEDLENPILHAGPEGDEPSISEILEPLKKFLGVWNSEKQITERREKYLEQVFSKHPCLQDNVLAFLQDLRQSYKGNGSEMMSADFLYFLGAPYFSEEAVADILAIPVFPGMLKDRLKMHFKEGNIACPCLVDIFLRAFNWDSSCLYDQISVIQSVATEKKKESFNKVARFRKRLYRMNLKILLDKR